ncbi:uncharacterized protein DUF4105 [Acinetobacter calcoaceticus]|uniref:Uncharacterized protein DUF4105 n=1 Tax=Acinetobacter calcoaceticus TaxID=471 RepID=A0A4R1XWC8_ACICA|nr:uncharacterized protein DUF4105 [Acinetobacter calcoaceticus]
MIVLALLSCASLRVGAVGEDSATRYITQAEQQQLYAHKTWQALFYANAQGKSEVRYAGFFLNASGQRDLKTELDLHIAALFKTSTPNQSIRCRFPARSAWLMQQLNISAEQLPELNCPEYTQWFDQVKPYKATLIYATDFMGNPSSMFGHTLLRLDPKDQQQLNLVSYAVNYAATVKGGDNWSYAFKGLTGQYPGEYSLMPYYKKVKEYADFESRDLWEYELNLNPTETAFMVQHLWELQQVSFPYYFISDNCAYRLLGLIDLVRPEANLQTKFGLSTIPMETLKALQQQNLVKDVVYRPALETQLLAQARQHGQGLAQQAHRLAATPATEIEQAVAGIAVADQAKILEMAYDDLYLQLIAHKVTAPQAQPRLRQLLSVRSQIDMDKQRADVPRPKSDPSQAHAARLWSMHLGQIQGEQVIQLGLRQAYHDLIDPQAGLRFGTQMQFLDGALQWREEQLKLAHFNLLSVNSYNPINPFKTPLSWGFNLGWQQESLAAGRFNPDQQHGVMSLKAQAGYSVADESGQHLCYLQGQSYLQSGQALDKGWRIGLGPTLGCQNIWTDQFNSLIQVELPYWEDQQQWNLRINTAMQYRLAPQHALRLNMQYQQQQSQDWLGTTLGYIHYF